MRKVATKLAANSVTAVSSMTAETGSHLQAEAANDWYANTSEPTLNRQPIASRHKLAPMSFVLNSTRIPLKAGSTRCPIAKTMVAIKPTVSACREAPQIPSGYCAKAAHTPKAPATMSQA